MQVQDGGKFILEGRQNVPGLATGLVAAPCIPHVVGDVSTVCIQGSCVPWFAAMLREWAWRRGYQRKRSLEPPSLFFCLVLSSLAYTIINLVLVGRARAPNLYCVLSEWWRGAATARQAGRSPGISSRDVEQAWDIKHTSLKLIWLCCGSAVRRRNCSRLRSS